MNILRYITNRLINPCILVIKMNINNLRNKDGKIWLNVASSTCLLDEFINIDNHIFLQILKRVPFVKYFPIKFFIKKYRPLISAYIDGIRSKNILQYDCRKPLNFPNDSVDHILCSHFIMNRKK